jgi:hypothetical protein
MSSFQALAPELITKIGSYLDQVSLAAITRTCGRFNTCCIPTLYKDVVVDDRGCIYLDRSVDQNPQLATYVQSITFDHETCWADHYADSILPKLPKIHHLAFFAREQDFFDRGFKEDENALGLGLWWPGPDGRELDSVQAAAASIGNWLPDLQTCECRVFISLKCLKAHHS